MEMRRPLPDAPSTEPEVMVVASPAWAAEALRTLRDAGVHGPVRVVHDGAEALERLSPQVTPDPHPGELPSVVVVDLDTTGDTAGQLLRRIRGSRRAHALPFIVLATHARHSGLARSLDDGASIGLLKPLTPVALAAAIRAIGLGRLLPVGSVATAAVAEPPLLAVAS